MIYPDESPEEWCEKYKIKILKREYICQNCKKPVELVKPFALKGYRGIQSIEHDTCGAEFVVSVAVPVSKTKDKWDRLLFGGGE